MRFYDFAKAKELALRLIEKEDVTSISLGMSRDWFWTADEIWNRTDGFLIDLGTVERIGGIDGSFWDTPVLKAEYADGHTECWGVWKHRDDKEENI